jgi:hypothetical protein
MLAVSIMCGGDPPIKPPTKHLPRCPRHIRPRNTPRSHPDFTEPGPFALPAASVSVAPYFSAAVGGPTLRVSHGQDVRPRGPREWASGRLKSRRRPTSDPTMGKKPGLRVTLRRTLASARARGRRRPGGIVRRQLGVGKPGEHRLGQPYGEFFYFSLSMNRPGVTRQCSIMCAASSGSTAAVDTPTRGGCGDTNCIGRKFVNHGGSPLSVRIG